MRGQITPFRLLVGLGFLVVVAFVLLLRPAGSFPGGRDQYLLEPDIAHPVAPLVHVAGHKPAKGRGNLFFVDVQEERATELQVLFPWLQPAHSTLIPASDLIPPGSNDHAFIEAELRQMATSQKIAAAVALRHLGYHVAVRPNGVLVDQIDLGTDAAGKLQPTDDIVAVDGHPTLTEKALLAYEATVKPRQTLTLTVLRGTHKLTIRVRTIGVRGHALIGFAPEQSVEIGRLPFKVAIDSGEIGGPSAGLAFTLEVMQQLGHDVTHGYRVAATGAINIDGTVSAIGGVEQKTWGVREAHAQVFLVPVDGGNSKEAKRFAGPDLTIIPVTSFAQALRALAALPKLR